MVHGYRLIDLNVLRLAMQTAQHCGHSSLILTEVNAEKSQVRERINRFHRYPCSIFRNFLLLRRGGKIE